MAIELGYTGLGIGLFVSSCMEGKEWYRHGKVLGKRLVVKQATTTMPWPSHCDDRYMGLGIRIFVCVALKGKNGVSAK